MRPPSQNKQNREQNCGDDEFLSNCICGCYVHSDHGVCVESRGQLAGICSLLLPAEGPRSNTGCQAWQQLPLSTHFLVIWLLVFVEDLINSKCYIRFFKF